MFVCVGNKTHNKSFYVLRLNKVFIFWFVYFFFIALRPNVESNFIFFSAYDARIMSECNHRSRVCRIKANPGGYFIQFMNTYQILSKNKYNIIVDGTCASSCTYLMNFMYLDDPKSVCITSRAQFWIHAGSIRNQTDIPIYYVGKLQKLIDRKGGISASKDRLVLKYDDLKTIYRSC